MYGREESCQATSLLRMPPKEESSWRYQWQMFKLLSLSVAATLLNVTVCRAAMSTSASHSTLDRPYSKCHFSSLSSPPLAGASVHGKCRCCGQPFELSRFPLFLMTRSDRVNLGKRQIMVQHQTVANLISVNNKLIIKGQQNVAAAEGERVGRFGCSLRQLYVMLH